MIDRIVVHCSATPPGMDIGAAEIDQWHKERGWVGNGYSDVIRRDGRVEVGRRPYGAVLAHARGFNRNAIAVCLVGGLNDAGEPAALFTRAQALSLGTYLHVMSAAYRNAKICGHHDLPDVAKACPSFSVPHFLETGEFVLPSRLYP